MIVIYKTCQPQTNKSEINRGEGGNMAPFGNRPPLYFKDDNGIYDFYFKSG